MPLMVMVTAPKKSVKKLVSFVLEAKLCACVNMIKGVESVFWWQGKIHRADEVVLLMKTKKQLFERLKKAVKANHPYEVPEIIAFNILKGNAEYLAWINDSCRN